ncbi:glycoside hydrolase family 127 protein [candidate division KSB1 bacterium]|nr:glycoside hydrolase family 127 protein [candidate division KSB1 bacterium]
MEGYLGEKIDLCIRNRILAQDVDYLVEPFRHKEEMRWWQTEFWGKWFKSAAAAYEYTQDPRLREKLDLAVELLIRTQTPEGYIGNYADDRHLQGWDVWGRKYTLLGLLAYYDITQNESTLIAARRLVDHLMTEVGPGKENIVTTGNYRGMPSSSILEPLVLLYHRTKDERFLNFAKYIVRQWETAEGPQLISKALQGIPVAERFPHPTNWWSWENGQKAYEMMSCYEGLLELYRVTSIIDYFNAVNSAMQNIIDTEINIAGSGASMECWYDGKNRQTEPALHMMETCVTMTWMKLCHNMLLLTGNPKYADLIEQSVYNALLSAMTPNGDEFAKYSPLVGIRQLGEDQCNMNLNCCTANGPRGVMLIPRTAVMIDRDGPVVNLYNQGTATVQLQNSQTVIIHQHTVYPVSGNIVMDLELDGKQEFVLSLRIPAWSRQARVTVNNKPVEDIKPGSYLRIKREWQNNDRVVMDLDMCGHVIFSSGDRHKHLALTRGPLVLARDTRMAGGDIDDVVEPIENSTDEIQLETVTPTEENIRMTFKTRLKTGTDREGDYNEPVDIFLVDYASAGNTWSPASRYRVWLPVVLDPRKGP